MPKPKDVFDHPEAHWPFLMAKTDDNFEGQYFDRKEAGRPDKGAQLDKRALSGIREQVAECISAFANANRDGGLLVLGISSAGEAVGVDHLTEDQLNSLTAFQQLRSHTAVARLVECQATSPAVHILLIYAPYVHDAICETVGGTPKSWLRTGKQNSPMDDQQRDRVRRDKLIVDFERRHCCPFDPRDLDEDVFRGFRKVFLVDARYSYTDEEILREAGAVDYGESGPCFTNAGLLFFASNPRRTLGWVHIRLLRYDADSTTPPDRRGLPNFDRTFDGSMPQQIRKLRSFFHDSGFFKTYQRRNPAGGFVEEPELPPIAVDEAIVNAVAHRDYGIQLPIECVQYRDAFTVENPGRVLQRGHDLPDHFSLDSTTLNSMPRNPKLMEWLKQMRDEQGAEFVRALGEGTRRMREEMVRLGLPAPSYSTDHHRTIVTLYNNADQRAVPVQIGPQAQVETEYTNLFPLDVMTKEGYRVDPRTLRHTHKEFLGVLKDALRAKGWYIDYFAYGRLIAHRQGQSYGLPDEVQRVVRFYPAYIIQLEEYWGRLFLSLDYHLEVKNTLSVHALLRQMPAGDLANRVAVAQWNGWQRARIIQADEELTQVSFLEIPQEESVPSDKVIPDLPLGALAGLLHAADIKFDLHSAIKRYSLALDPASARSRAEKTVATAGLLAEAVFPLTVGQYQAMLHTTPEPLHRDEARGELQAQTLQEPVVEFGRRQETPDIRTGITSYGAYDDARKSIELVPVCDVSMRDAMARLIARLKTGSRRFTGAERTFSVRFSYNSIITAPTVGAITDECRRLLQEHPAWAGDEALNRLFLVYTPESGYASDDETSPYYQAKRLLLEQGIPCQMVDTPTLHNPDWKDLTLTLNIVAKCGVTPWVLPNSIPDADFFIGLSYTQSRKGRAERLVGYSTVFNQFGRWMFYSGNTEAFSYDKRTKYFARLTKQTLERLQLSETPSVYFHYSADFSRDDRLAILAAAREVRPQGTYSFVWLNQHHNLRLYDSKAETDGSLRRGSYVRTKPNQILISTTGYNPFRKSLGTPKPLEATIRIEAPEGVRRPEPDPKSLAVQILCLTKLNWASTDSVCGEPITTKYAHDIAYLTDAFLRQTGTFRLHRALANTPWFI